MYPAPGHHLIEFARAVSKHTGLVFGLSLDYHASVDSVFARNSVFDLFCKKRFFLFSPFVLCSTHRFVVLVILLRSQPQRESTLPLLLLISHFFSS